MGIPWSNEEINLLHDLIGDYPREMVFREYCRRARKQGLPQRTHKAIQVKATNLGLTFKCFGQWLGTGDVAELLGIHSDRVDHWTRRYKEELGVLQISRNKRVVRRSSWVQWARVPAHQRLLGGIPAYRLLRLLDDAELAHAIAKAHPRIPDNRIMVRCVDTGFKYPSIMAAAKANYVTHNAIRLGIKECRPVAGRRYEVVS